MQYFYDPNTYAYIGESDDDEIITGTLVPPPKVPHGMVAYYEPKQDKWLISQTRDLELMAARNKAILAIKNFSEKTRRMFLYGATTSEIAAWPNKAERARRFLAGTGTDTDTELLAIESQYRGKSETSEQLARLQLEKERYYMKAVALTDGLSKNGIARIKQADSIQIPLILQDLKAEAEKLLKEFF